MRLIHLLTLLLFGASLPLAATGAAQSPNAASQPERLGRVHFPVSCSPEAQKQFERAVAILHSFWYDQAEREFSAIAARDPDCAMAYWGIAMSQYHLLWEPPDPAGLKKGATAIEKARAIGAPTERERDYIEAMGAFYRDWETVNHQTRALAYEKAMERLHQRYPKDREAAIFYALALLSTAPPSDKDYTNQRKAGAMLERFFAEQPDHPGVAHYLIHAYDYPKLARQALPAARRYSEIAPSVPHALHMPSHIFIRLGLWEDAIQSNRASSAAARRHAARFHPDAASFEDLHAMDYLAYAYLQEDQDEEARRVLKELRAIEKVEPPADFAAAYAFASIPARFALERRQWKEAASLSLHPNKFAWDRHPAAEAILHFARAIGAARSGDPAAARSEVAKLAELRQAAEKAGQSYWAEQVEIQRRAAAAWTAYAEGQRDKALDRMRAAASLEDATEKHPVTPGPVIPARELLGDMLLLAGEPGAALKEFETSLRASPNRFNAFYGAARAAELAGNQEQAQAYYARLRAPCAHTGGAAQESR